MVLMEKYTLAESSNGAEGKKTESSNGAEGKQNTLV